MGLGLGMGNFMNNNAITVDAGVDYAEEARKALYAFNRYGTREPDSIDEAFIAGFLAGASIASKTILEATTPTTMGDYLNAIREAKHKRHIHDHPAQGAKPPNLSSP